MLNRLIIFLQIIKDISELNWGRGCKFTRSCSWKMYISQYIVLFVTYVKFGCNSVSHIQGEQSSAIVCQHIQGARSSAKVCSRTYSEYNGWMGSPRTFFEKLGSFGSYSLHYLLIQNFRRQVFGKIFLVCANVTQDSSIH